MNKRNILIAFLLTLPVIALIILSQATIKDSERGGVKHDSSISYAPTVLPTTAASAINNPPKGPPRTLEDARQRVRDRLAVLEKMTPEEWQNEQTQRTLAKEKQIEELQKFRDNAMNAKPFPDLSGLTAESPSDPKLDRGEETSDGETAASPTVAPARSGQLDLSH